MNTLLRALLATSIAALLLSACGQKSETDKAAEAAGAAVTDMAKSTMDAAKEAADKTEVAAKDAADATLKAAEETKDKAVEMKDKAADVLDAAKKEAAK
ncbi:MAG: hypothetical protein H7Z18_00340 [Methylophilaceae bacterium]|nr:hypothetical protein [Methylophilaceae bacterium]